MILLINFFTFKSILPSPSNAESRGNSDITALVSESAIPSALTIRLVPTVNQANGQVQVRVPPGDDSKRET